MTVNRRILLPLLAVALASLTLALHAAGSTDLVGAICGVLLICATTLAALVEVRLPWRLCTLAILGWVLVRVASAHGAPSKYPIGLHIVILTIFATAEVLRYFGWRFIDMTKPHRLTTSRQFKLSDLFPISVAVAIAAIVVEELMPWQFFELSNKDRDSLISHVVLSASMVLYVLMLLLPPIWLGLANLRNWSRILLVIGMLPILALAGGRVLALSALGMGISLRLCGYRLIRYGSLQGFSNPESPAEPAQQHGQGDLSKQSEHGEQSESLALVDQTPAH